MWVLHGRRGTNGGRTDLERGGRRRAGCSGLRPTALARPLALDSEVKEARVWLQRSAPGVATSIVLTCSIIIIIIIIIIVGALRIT